MGWEEAAQAKKASLLQLIPQEWQLHPADIPLPTRQRNVTDYIRRFLDPHQLEITDSHVIAILEKIRSSEWTALEVTRAFCHRAALAHQLTNCLSEICFDAAEDQARWLDKYLLTNGRVVGPLHGLPVSMKDKFHIEGLDSACGYVYWLGEKKDSDSEGALVKSLRSMGAVYFVKTNVPMSMLMGETSNNIIGSTVNPYCRILSAGGASGGEGALLALRGSPIGWGTDYAGSIRIPCAFNNLYGLRPSFGRLPASGVATTLSGLPTAGGVVGPMARDLLSLVTMTRAVLANFPWRDDVDVIEMPWNEDVIQSVRNRSCGRTERNGKLVFGIMASDEFVQPHPPVQRAISLVKDALLEHGYEVVEWSPPAHNTAVDLLFHIFGSTAGQEIRHAIDASGEPPMQLMRSWYDETASKPSSTAEFWDLCDKRHQYQEAYHAYWEASRAMTVANRVVDGVILPVAPSTAVEEGSFGYYGPYSGIVNFLDYTAVSFPVTFADPLQDMEQADYKPRNAVDESIWRSYRKDLFGGAPVGLQIMGRRFQEEKVLGLAEAIAKALQNFRGAHVANED